jgi:hypothetical protein
MAATPAYLPDDGSLPDLPDEPLPLLLDTRDIAPIPLCRTLAALDNLRPPPPVVVALVEPDQRVTKRLLAMSAIRLVATDAMEDRFMVDLLLGYLRPIYGQVWLSTRYLDTPDCSPDLLRVLAVLPTAATWNQVAHACGLAPRTVRQKLACVRQAYQLPAWVRPADLATAILESLAA